MKTYVTYYHVLLCLIVASLWPSLLGAQSQDASQSILCVKPQELLPPDTNTDSLGVKVRLEPCKDDQLLSAVAPDTSYKLVVTTDFNDDGELTGWDDGIWSNGAVHEIALPISFADYQFQPGKDSVLTFRVDVNRGYVFVSGAGEILDPSNTTIRLHDDSKGTVIGHPKRCEGTRMD